MASPDMYDDDCSWYLEIVLSSVLVDGGRSKVTEWCEGVS